MKIKEYELFNQFKEQNTKRAEVLLKYQQDESEARARLQELETQYDYTFTQSVEKGEDATEKLDGIMRDIELQKEVVARRQREHRLAREALPKGEITSVDVVDRYRAEFASGVQEEYLGKVNPKLELARDLILSAIDDHREYRDAYGDIYKEIKELADANHKEGKTRYIMAQIHPTEDARVFGAQGTIGGVRKLLEQVSQYTYGQKPSDYKYIDVAPKNNTTKAGK